MSVVPEADWTNLLLFLLGVVCLGGLILIARVASGDKKPTAVSKHADTDHGVDTPA